MVNEVRVRVFISGRVQGVFFRKNVIKQANKLELAGWVRNLKSGQVEAVFEGVEVNVKEMVEWCKKGPLLAQVDNVTVKSEVIKNLKHFEKR
jgi:acylphosphatase